MSDQDLLHVLEEIRDNQKLQLERQAKTLELQREQFSLVQNNVSAQNAFKIGPSKSRPRAHSL